MPSAYKTSLHPICFPTSTRFPTSHSTHHHLLPGFLRQLSTRVLSSHFCFPPHQFLSWPVWYFKNAILTLILAQNSSQALVIQCTIKNQASMGWYGFASVSVSIPISCPSLYVIAILASYRSSNEPTSFLSRGLFTLCSFCLECYDPKVLICLTLIPSQVSVQLFLPQRTLHLFPLPDKRYSPTCYVLYTTRIFPSQSLHNF